VESNKEDLIIIEDLCAIISDQCHGGRFGDNGQGAALREQMRKTVQGHKYFKWDGITFSIDRYNYPNV